MFTDRRIDIASEKSLSLNHKVKGRRWENLYPKDRSSNLYEQNSFCETLLTKVYLQFNLVLPLKDSKSNVKTMGVLNQTGIL